MTIGRVRRLVVGTPARNRNNDRQNGVAEEYTDIGHSLTGLTAADFGYGLAAAQVTKLLAETGVAVARFEPVSGDPFRAWYPAYDLWHRAATIARLASIHDPAVDTAIAAADICIIGGEDFPGHDWHPDARRLLERNPRLVILVIEAYPPGHPDHGRPAVELLAQATSGLAAELSNAGPVQLAFQPASYCAALHGLTALLAALCQRERDGAGQIVRTSLYEGALTLGTSHWMRASQATGGFNFAIPKDPRQLIFAGRDERYIQIVLGSAGSKGALYRILGIDDPTVKPGDSGMPTGRGDPRNFFGDVDLLAEYVARFDSTDLLAQLNAAGIACSPVLAPGGCWDDPQVAHLGAIAHDADGTAHIGLPMRGTLGARSATGPLMPTVPAAALPLAGIRVLDFGIFVAGPYAGVALADLGADVIKVETPLGDPNRNIYRSHAAVNRGKRAFTIDLKNPDGQRIARRLIDSAQVVLNNFRPGVSARLGVDPATLHATDPDKVVLEATGFGRTGPYGDRPGFDMIFQAFCGHDIRAGGVGNAPQWDRTAMVDYLLGMLDQVAVLIALWRRFAGAGGADLDLSLVDAGLFLMSELVRLPDGRFVGAPLNNATRTGFHPAEAMYRCRDGWIAVAARSEAMAAALAATLGFAAPVRAEWGDAQAAAIGAALALVDTASVLQRLADAGIWAAVCATWGDAALFDGAGGRELVMTTTNPAYGEVQQLGALFQLGSGRHTAPRGAPLPGEDTETILAEIGFAPAEVADFFDRKIVA